MSFAGKISWDDLADYRRYGQGCTHFARRHRGLGIHLIGYVHHTATFLHGDWASRWAQVLDCVHDGCVGRGVYGSCGGQESWDAHCVEAAAWGF